MADLHHLKLKTQADSKTVHWIQRHSLKVLILACLLITIVPSAYSQEDTNWQVESVTFVPIWSFEYQISAGGYYLAEYLVDLRFRSTDSSTPEYVDGHYSRNLPRWLNNTMIYHEYFREDFGDPPECNDPDTESFGFYDASTQTKELYCLIPPASYTDGVIDDYQYDTLERFPFDEHSVLINNRYLVNLPTDIWQDLQGTLTTTISAVDTQNWMAHGQTWWDSETQQPMARVNTTGVDSETFTFTNQMILLCPIENDACQPLVSVQDYVHGNVKDVVISPDGQTLLWSAFVYPQTEPILTDALGILEDLAAFVTDVQTGMTTEIFRLSDYNSTEAKSLAAQWSEDGLTLAISMENLTDISSPDNGLLLVQFSR